MIEDDLFEVTVDLTAIVSEALGEPRSVIPLRPSWFRLRTQVQMVQRCWTHVPPGSRAYLTRGDGRLVEIEKLCWAIPYTVTVNGKERPARGHTEVFITTQPNVAGKTIEECLK